MKVTSDTLTGTQITFPGASEAWFFVGPHPLRADAFIALSERDVFRVFSYSDEWVEVEDSNVIAKGATVATPDETVGRVDHITDDGKVYLEGAPDWAWPIIVLRHAT